MEESARQFRLRVAHYGAHQYPYQIRGVEAPSPHQLGCGIVEPIWADIALDHPLYGSELPLTLWLAPTIWSVISAAGFPKLFFPDLPQAIPFVFASPSTLFTNTDPSLTSTPITTQRLLVLCQKWAVRNRGRRCRLATRITPRRRSSSSVLEFLVSAATHMRLWYELLIRDLC